MNDNVLRQAREARKQARAERGVPDRQAERPPKYDQPDKQPEIVPKDDPQAAPLTESEFAEKNRAEDAAISTETYTRSEMQLVSRAIDKRWDIPAEVFTKLPRRLLRIAMNADEYGVPDQGRYTARDQMRATDLLDKLLKSNREAETQDKPKQHIHAVFRTAEQSRLDEIARSMGIEGMFEPARLSEGE